VRLRSCRVEHGCLVVRHYVCDEVIHRARADRCAEARGRVPAPAGRESGNNYQVVRRVELARRVGAAPDVMKRGRIGRAVLTNPVNAPIEESFPRSGLVIHNRSDGCPLRCTGAGATEGIHARRYAGNVQTRQYAMEDGRVVSDVWNALLRSRHG